MSLLAVVILAVALGPSLLLFGCAALVYAHDARAHRDARGLTDREVAQNSRPYLDPITPVYYGVHAPNGKVADQHAEDA